VLHVRDGHRYFSPEEHKALLELYTDTALEVARKQAPVTNLARNSGVPRKFMSLHTLILTSG
jgi:hypothetical protein